jgi:hypothetical protein
VAGRDRSARRCRFAREWQEDRLVAAFAGPDSAPAEGAAAGQTGAASAYAQRLLGSLDLSLPLCDAPGDERDASPRAAWARSGAMALTGDAAGPPLAVPFAVASCAAGAGRALASLAAALAERDPVPADASRLGPSLDGAALLGERAALDPRLRRRGSRSVGGSAQLLACADGWLALNLARPDDVALLPAWLERTPRAGQDAFAFAAETLLARARDELCARGREMGLPLAPVPRADELGPGGGWHHVALRGQARPRTRRPLVVDLSSLWAGPLCGGLLADCGARVVKVESRERPDGARRGESVFFDLLNGGKQSVVLPLREAHGRRALAELVARADVVIESSRPRALEQLGIDAAGLVARHGVTWIAITGHGREAPGANWVAFGDDAAVAAGLVATSERGEPLFCGDAIADPLTGLHAAVAALGALAAGEARLVDISLHAVAEHVRAFEHPAAFFEDTVLGQSFGEVARPRARAVRARAAAPGRDTERVLRELGIAC